MSKTLDGFDVEVVRQAPKGSGGADDNDWWNSGTNDQGRDDNDWSDDSDTHD